MSIFSSILSFMRRRLGLRLLLRMALCQKKILVPLGMASLVVILIVTLQQRGDPYSYPVVTSNVERRAFRIPAGVHLRRDSVHHQKRDEDKCPARSPEQILGQHGQRRTIFAKTQHSLPNYFLSKNSNEYNKVDESPMSHPYVVFLHHNKAGGSTVKFCLRSMAEGAGLMAAPVFTGYRRQRFHHMAAVRRRLSEKHLLMGGYTAGVCDKGLKRTAKCQYITLLRDPLDRLVSSYFYCKIKPGDQLCATRMVDARTASLAEWADHQSGFLLAQLTYMPEECKAEVNSSEPCWYQMKQALLERSCSYENLAELSRWVGNRLKDVFAAIGMLEEMDVTLELWEKATGLPFVKYCTGLHSTVSLNGHTVKTSDADQRARTRQAASEDPDVQRALKIDALIYDKAQQLFQLQVAKYKEMPGDDG